MIVLFTDFGFNGPYVGQMKSVLAQMAPAATVIDLMHDAPSFDPKASAYLLASLVNEFPENTVFLCVVDPGVGSTRKPVVLNAEGRWFVGPDNGLFNTIAIHAKHGSDIKWWCIDWQPKRLSSSFHGRDLFAPVAAMLANGEPVPGEPLLLEKKEKPHWLPDLHRIIYVDHFGNAVTGIRAEAVSNTQTLVVNGHRFSWARTFSDVNLGAGFWYENSNGLVEIAVNQGRANLQFNMGVGDDVHIVIH
ncbi:MAG: SAM-dependent chlorinase/fluorinase [Gammaproteobacteria bacterium]|jgi:S-adenosylmethionine hydrolase